MKRCLILFLILLLSTGTKRYIDGTSGNDTNGGTSWADAWATLGKLNTSAANGDTIYVVNTFVERYNPSHSGLVFIDSTREASWNDAQPDTLWSATFDGTGNSFAVDIRSGDDNLKFVGIHFIEGSLYAIQIKTAAKNTWFQQCKFTGNGLDLIAADTVNVISNLFLSNGSDSYAIRPEASSSQLNIYNNTIYGEYLVAGFGEVKADSINFQNNILVNTSSVSFDVTVRIDLSSDAKGAIKTWDYNAYYRSITDTWRFVNFFSTMATWVDSVNNYGAGANNESNSINTDPQLQNITTTAYITNSSPAYNAGTDLGYGDDMGYYQVAAASIDSTYKLRDDFTDVNNTALGTHNANWSVFSGDVLEVQTNKAEGGATGANIGFWREFKIDSVRASILVYPSDTKWVGIYVHLKDTTNTSTLDGYAVFWDFKAGADNDELSVQEFLNGSSTDLGSRVLLDAVDGDSLEIRMVNNSIQVLVNGVVKMQRGDSTYPNAGYVGINIAGTNSASIDNFRFGNGPLVSVPPNRRRWAN